MTCSPVPVSGLSSYMLTDAQLSEMISFTAKTLGIFRSKSSGRFFLKSLISTTSCTRKFHKKVVLNIFYFATKGQIKTEHRRLDYRSVPSKWWSNNKRWSLLLLSSPEHKYSGLAVSSYLILFFKYFLKKKRNQRHLATYWVFLYILLNLRRKHWEVPIEYNLSQGVHQRSIMYNQKNLLKEE